MKKIKLSIIIPAYNEEKIIEKTLKKVIVFLSTKKYSWEIVIVDDGSEDKTAEIVKDFKNKNVWLIHLPTNIGKGFALREGFLMAKGEYMIYGDADLSVSITNVDKFLEVLETKSEVAIGSRRVSGAKIVVHQPWLRETMGRVFTWLTRVVTGVEVADFTCGFKGFQREAAQKVFGRGLINRWAYDSEILFLANKYGYKITQIPIEWQNRGDTRVVLRKVIFESLIDLVKIRLFDMQGRYNNN